MLRTELLLVVALFTTSACALSHDPGAEDPPFDGAEGCLDPALDANALDELAAEALLERLHHEVGHAADRVARVNRGEEDWDDEPLSLDYFVTEDGGGSIEITGSPLTDGREGADLRIAFTRWSGRHGSFGLSALEGEACVRVLLDDPTSGAEAFTATVLGTVGFAGGGALEPAPMTNASYIASWGRGRPSTIEGEVAGFSIDSP